MSEFLNMAITIDPPIMDELKSVLHHHTKTHKQIDRLGRTLFDDKAEEYRDTPIITSWESLLKMMIDEYWASPERLNEADLISCFDHE
jgi:hypothetical protein